MKKGGFWYKLLGYEARDREAAAQEQRRAAQRQAQAAANKAKASREFDPKPVTDIQRQALREKADAWRAAQGDSRVSSRSTGRSVRVSASTASTSDTGISPAIFPAIFNSDPGPASSAPACDTGASSGGWGGFDGGGGGGGFDGGSCGGF